MVRSISVLVFKLKRWAFWVSHFWRCATHTPFGKLVLARDFACWWYGNVKEWGSASSQHAAAAGCGGGVHGLTCCWSSSSSPCPVAVYARFLFCRVLYFWILAIWETLENHSCVVWGSKSRVTLGGITLVLGLRWFPSTCKFKCCALLISALCALDPL